MKKTYILLLSFICLLLVNDAAAQLKLGDQPTSVQKSVILDLQGSNGRQGVWLPRISDTTNATGIDALNPPDGVMIFHTPSSQVMIRRNGFWSSLQTGQIYTTGTSGTDFTINTSGNTHTFNLPTASAVNRGLLSSADWTTFNNKGTVSSVGAGYGINGGTITTTGTHAIDTLSISTRAWRQKGIDSVRGLLNSYIPATRTLTINGTAFDLSANRSWNVGTVTSVAAGYGINGGTITATGTHAVDSFSVSTRAWRQKGIDSIVGIINGFVPATRSINGLSLSFNHTFSVGSSGTDANIVSGGSTHTFNFPTASATNRGLLSNADWTTFNNKLSPSRTLTINGSTQDLTANRTWNVGTVTSVGAGYGISGGTITGTGTHAVDSFSVATRAWRQKGIDSVASLINGFIPATRTLNGLALSANQTFVAGTSGTNFNIVSAGTTHTFNIPDASATARGVVTTGAQTMAGVKTFSTGATISGATANASNLTLGITSATTPGTHTDRYLTVNGSGVVTVNYASVTAVTGRTTIKNYTVTMNDLPNNISALSSDIVTFTIAGANFSTTSTVHVSPTQALQATTTIGWARVLNSTTIQMGVSAGWSQQNFTPGNSSTFNITVMEF